ncbi:MAG: UDP-galactopyranose mutase [Pseudomonadota bacterium]
MPFPLRARLSPEVTEAFFARYVRKQWALPLSTLPAAVVQRVAPRPGSDEARYFARARFQGLPADGYSALFAAILDHPRIDVALETPYLHADRAHFDLCLTSMSMDLFYGFRFGPLPYRAVRFETAEEWPAPEGVGTISLSDHPRATRAHNWRVITGGGQGPAKVTVELPGAPEAAGGARQYPVHTLAGGERLRLARYQNHAAREARTLRFIGRCGTFRYLNMDQVVAQSLVHATKLFGPAPRLGRAS